jgi:hypothetical protein
MKFFLVLLVFTTMSAMTQCTGAKTQITSIYTDLAGSQCKTIKEDEETGSSVQECPGVGGFHLLVADDDARMSVSVVTPDNREHSLDYWNVITRSLSSLGKKAEWRVVKRKGEITPIALIVQVDAFEQESRNSSKHKSYLAVAKITPERICVTDKISPALDADEQARRAADDSANKVCLKP